MTYVRDPVSKMLINTDEEYYRSVLLDRQQRREAASLHEQVDSLKNELEDIRGLLQQVLNGKNYG